MIRQYLWNLLVSIDQTASTLTGGDPDETISSRAGKKVRAGTANIIWRGLYMALNTLDKGHCEESIEDDEGKDEVQ